MPISRFGAGLLPVRATLILCWLDVLGYSAARWPSLRSDLRRIRMFWPPLFGFLSTTIHLLRYCDVRLLSQSFNMFVDGALSAPVSHVGTDERIPVYATPLGTMRLTYTARFPWNFVIYGPGTDATSKYIPGYTSLPYKTPTSCAPWSVFEFHLHPRYSLLMCLLM